MVGGGFKSPLAVLKCQEEEKHLSPLKIVMEGGPRRCLDVSRNEMSETTEEDCI